MPLKLLSIKASLLPASLAPGSWREALQSLSFRIQSAVTLSVGILLILIMPLFLHDIQLIQGTVLNDPLLTYLPAVNLSWPIFLLLYASILLVLANLIFQPQLLLKSLQAYILLTLLRATSIYLFPLEPDPRIIPLVDPFVDHFFYQKIIITKDLFFSGHIATMSLLYFITPFPFLKKSIGITAVWVAAFILLQHVHYTIDVIVAPLPAYLAYSIVSLRLARS